MRRTRHSVTRPRGHSATFLVGIGGQAGSGKSMVARYFAKQGAEVIDADRIGWRLLEKSAPTYPNVVRAFGPGILDARGDIDRKKLGAVVFKDKAAMMRLNRIVHPPLLTELRRQAFAPLPRAAGKEPASMIRVIDAALLFAWGWHRKVDYAILVTAARQHKVERLMKNGLSRVVAVQRVNSQMSEFEMERLAHYAISNDGTTAELERESELAWMLVHDLAIIRDGFS